MTSWGLSFTAMAFRRLATASGCNSTSVWTRMPRSAPMASAVRSVSWHAATPQDTATTSVAMPASFRRTASSTAISSKGFIDIMTLARSTPVPSDLTRTLTLKSTTRLTGTRTFMRMSSEAVFRPIHRRRTLFGIRLTQKLLVQLADAGLGQCVHEDDPPGHAVLGDDALGGEVL